MDDDRDGFGWTPYIHAAEEGHIETLAYLESRGADILASDASGMTALDHARKQKLWPVVDYLEARFAERRGSDPAPGAADGDV